MTSMVWPSLSLILTLHTLIFCGSSNFLRLMYIVLVSKVVVGVLTYPLIFFQQRNARNLIKVKTH